MKKSTLVFLKTMTWIACLSPLACLVYGAVTDTLGPDATRTITFSTGLAALRLLVISLAVTPLRKLFPGLNWLIKFRRLLGLFAFFYASLHLLAYVALYSYYDTNAMMQDILRRRFITVGVAAWLLLVPLVLTSTAGMIRRLGGKRWNLLHTLVYAAVCLGLLHYWWQVKTGVMTPLNITLMMAALFFARPAIALWTRSQRRATQATQVTRTLAAGRTWRSRFLIRSRLS